MMARRYPGERGPRGQYARVWAVGSALFVLPEQAEPLVLGLEVANLGRRKQSMESVSHLVVTDFACEDVLCRYIDEVLETVEKTAYMNEQRRIRLPCSAPLPDLQEVIPMLCCLFSRPRR